MKTLTGTVISNKMNQTIIVEVAHTWTHPIYKKLVKRTKKYPVHDGAKAAAVGDQVTFSECRPISKTVHFTLVEVHKPNLKEKK